MPVADAVNVTVAPVVWGEGTLEVSVTAVTGAAATLNPNPVAVSELTVVPALRAHTCTKYAPLGSEAVFQVQLLVEL